MVIACGVKGTELALRAAWNHQHNALESQNLFISPPFFFRNNQTTWDFYNTTECFWSKIHSSSHFHAIWHNGFPCHWQHCETCCSKPWVYCFWILLLMFFITTLFQCYALLDILTSRLYYMYLRQNCALPQPIIHKILINPEQLTPPHRHISLVP